jgi:orotate phosphoribosyltransferase
MNYRSIDDLSRDTTALARELPSDIDLVVGIPRSGLLAANLLCLQLNTRMTDVQGLRDRRLLSSGYRYGGKVSGFDDIQRVLVVDDSVKTGRQMRETKAELAEMDLPFDVEYAAIYVSSTGHRHVDYWGEVIHDDRFFEWNMMHHPILKLSCVDIDGVLCRDPTPEENDDGERYVEFLQTVEPSLVPTERIGWLVTSRLEKYRPETEAWLDRHDIHYDELVMMDHESAEERRAASDHSEYKARVYTETGAKLFIESNPRQATTIAELSKKPAFSYETNELVKPGTVASVQQKSSEYLTRFRETPVAFSLTASRYAVDVLSGMIDRRVGARRQRR